MILLVLMLILALGYCEEGIQESNQLSLSDWDNEHLEVNITATKRTMISVMDSFTLVNQTEEFTSSKQRTKRAINAKIVRERDFPFMVGVNYMGRLGCGGAVLTPRLILTAAHCMSKVRPDSVSVLDMSGDGVSRKYYSVAEHILHEEYGAGSVNDIAILVLREPIPNARPVKIQKKSQRVSIGSKAYALGWGRTESGEMSKELRSVELPLLFPRQCDGREARREGFWVCVDTRKGNTCFGDSGGPLMYGKYQIGIASKMVYKKGEEPCTTAKIGLFTRVSAYVDWIGNVASRYR